MKKSTLISRFILLLVLITLISHESFSFPVEPTCEIDGTISDEKSGEGLPYATIQLISSVDQSFFKGTISDAKGNFSIDGLPPGKYHITASYMGYEPQKLDVEIAEKKTKLNILLSSKHLALDEVEIKSEKKLVEHNIEKTTINVTKDATVTGGTAVDVLQTMPSVDFDVNGNLHYRGSDRVTVLINGQKSELSKTLEQIPADQVDKIELINNPSAKYEAEGMSGIINIVLKSGKKARDNTTVMINAGYPETLGGNAGYSGVSAKSNFFVNAGIQHQTKFQTKEHWRDNYGDPDALNYYQYDRQDENLNNVMVNARYGYNLNNKQKIGLSFVGSTRFNNADRGIDYETLDKNGNIVYESYKDIDISLNNYTIDGNLDYQKLFDENGRQFKTSLHYSLLDQLQEMDNVYYPELNEENTVLQNTYSEQLNHQLVFRADYEHPIKDSIDIATGYFFDMKDLLNDFIAEDYKHETDSWENDTALSNIFSYQQYINAAYFDFYASLKYFVLQLGLRAEYTYNKQDGSKKDEYFNLFPSLKLSKNLGNHFNIFIAYSKRINRPTIKMLNPYTNEYADILNMHVGNPDLKPEYVNSFEAGSQFVFEKVSGSASVYYRIVDQAISRVKFATDDSALLVTFMNLDYANLFGGELLFSYNPFEWWLINGNGNIFYTAMKGEYGPNQIDRKLTGWTGNLSMRFKIPFGFGIQLSGYYRSKLPDVMGTYMEIYYIDFAATKSVFKGKGKLIFRISDVFNTYRYGLDLNGIDENGYSYSQKNRRKNESQYFVLSFVYNIDGKEKKQKKTNFYLDSYGK